MSNERGHLLEGVPKSEKNPWGDFVGTWDLPKKIPGIRLQAFLLPTTEILEAAYCVVYEYTNIRLFA